MKNEKYTENQIRFVLSKPKHVKWETFCATFNEVFEDNRSVASLKYLYATRKKASNENKGRTRPYSEEQKQWLANASKDDLSTFNEVFNETRSEAGIYNKWARLQSAFSVIKTEQEVPENTQMEEVSENTQKRYARTRHHWTPQEELEVLVNFYSLSVDEARDRFQRPYTAIAKRLEQMVDMTEPHHEALLMEAAKIINQQKAMMRKPTRKERRMAKRMAKIAKKQERLARKMGGLE